MSEIGCVVAAVAARALEYRVIPRVCVAVRTCTVLIAMGDWEERFVITRGQGRGEPPGRGVAGGASGRPACGRVVRISGAGVILRVARVAIRRRTCKHIIDVAQIAGDIDVRAGQRERRVVMVERCSCP